ncbi:hypothetical protein [Fodinicola feengrottensis]|uniref:hypothetical protein n=1 Tax=Fodinicola feengrottensis TaxID=435914 RepID=UPI0013D32603|nr:hypothetical protein [Fodinicola feengrottensis]
MGTTIEEATRIGQSVQDYLTDADTYDPEATDDRTEILLKRLASLRGVGLVTETQLMVLHDALISGGIVEDPKADPYTVGGVMIHGPAFSLLWRESAGWAALRGGGGSGRRGPRRPGRRADLRFARFRAGALRACRRCAAG